QHLVCIGNRVSGGQVKDTIGDDAQVTLHELQHGMTVKSYSLSLDEHLGELWYDEAGALNEGISDFVALVLSKEHVEAAGADFDVKEFSRWALGKYFGRDSTRGAHKCAKYSSDYPSCDHYALG
ncbi:MAG: hypothetical protein CUN55_20330, partial [Phototrophicales bacterium]